MLPIIFSVAKRFGGSTLTYALPAAGAFAAMHALVPPHPGPVAAAELLGANIGLLVLVGAVIALPTWYFGGYVFGKWAGKRFDLKLPASFLTDVPRDENVTPPRFSLVLTILLLPLALIFLDTGLNTLTVMGAVDGGSNWVQFLRMLGKTPVALLITVLFALIAFSGRHSGKHLEKVCDGALGPICSIILVTGAGGMFGGVLRTSGIGDALADTLSDTGMPVIVAAFVISAALRVAQGSATVALTTTAALVAPMVAATAGLSEFDLCFIVVAIAGGATVLSHVNDSGFWLVSRFLEMDEKTTLKTWTVMETLLGGIAFILAVIGSLIL
jgi:GntP family gluconate:H+ symporter